MTVAKRLLCVSLVLLITSFIVACGGGGGASAVTVTAPSATVTGTVSGTTVVAYDAITGSEVARNVASGTPKTFTLSLPLGASYKFYLIENEGSDQRTYPLYQGATNVFAVGGSSSITINLGFVATSSGTAVPTNNPLSVSGVTSGGTDTTVPANLASSVFATTDLEGTWYYHGLASGDAASSQLPGWFYGTAVIDNTGAATCGAITDSAGTAAYTPNVTNFSINQSGIVTPTIDSTGQRIMTTDKNMMIEVSTGAPGNASGVRGYNLLLWQKNSGAFVAADLAGTWNAHYLGSGDAPNWSGWGHGILVINNDGTSNWTTVVQNDSNQSSVSGGTFSISSSGVVSNSGSPFSAHHGIMSQDKNIIIATINGGGGGKGLIIYQKNGGSFTTSDLSGTWKLFLLTTGDSPQWLGWAYAAININASGAATWSYVNRSNGDTTNVSSGTFAISSDGIITSAYASLHGSMSQDKKLMVMTMTDGGGGYNLMIGVK